MTKDVVASEQLDLKKLVEAIREIAGEHLDRVILFGSCVTVLLHFPTSDSVIPEGLIDMFHQITRQRKITNDIDESLSQLSHEFPPLSFDARDAQGVDQLRDFKPCLESQLLSSGKVLWSSSEFKQYPAFPVDEARHSAVSYEITFATRYLDTARYEIALLAFQTGTQQDEYDKACTYAHASACKCLRAMMYANDIGPSDSDKWCFDELLTKLIAVMPQAALLLPCVASLPNRFAPRVDDIGATRQEARNATAAAMRIHRFARKSTMWNYLRSASETRAAARQVAAKLDKVESV